MKTLNTFLLSIALLMLASQISFAQGSMQTNYFAGTGAGSKNTGTGNTFVGHSAGKANTSGSLNTFVGDYAGSLNTTGMKNSFFGSRAGYSNTTGVENSFFGSYAGQNNNASFNSFFGYYSGTLNTTGQHNSFFGREAGRNNSSGAYNVFIGARAGYSNTSAGGSTFVGFEAGRLNATAIGNTFIGFRAGENNTGGQWNSFVGSLAGRMNSSGSYNVFMGHQAGMSNTTGQSNSAIGRDANMNTTTGSNNVAIGKDANRRNTTGLNNVALGVGAGKENLTGNGNTSIGYLAGMPINLANLSNATAIGFRAQVTASNALVLGSISGVNGATANTNVGIGVTAPTYRLHVNGDAAKPGSSAWTVASDKRLKKDIKEFKDGLEIINQIKPVKYKYNGKAGMPTENEYIGVIAQEVEEVAPYMIHKFSYADSTGATEEYLDFDATALPFIIINAIKDQQQILEEKDVQLQAVLEELQVLKEELAEIKGSKPGKKGGAANPFSDKSTDETSMDRTPQLLHNIPNPATESTSISYELPSADTQARISVHSMTGEQMADYDVSGNTTGEIQITTGNWKNGIYIYQLWVNGSMADSKRMLVNR